MKNNKKMIRARVDNDTYEALKKMLKHNNTKVLNQNRVVSKYINRIERALNAF